VHHTTSRRAQVSRGIVYEQQEVQSYLNELCANLHMSLSAAMTIAEIYARINEGSDLRLDEADDILAVWQELGWPPLQTAEEWVAEHACCFRANATQRNFPTPPAHHMMTNDVERVVEMARRLSRQFSAAKRLSAV
jgi:hypothetical protein